VAMKVGKLEMSTLLGKAVPVNRIKSTTGDDKTTLIKKFHFLQIEFVESLFA
jgi:hypothetical protein